MSYAEKHTVSVTTIADGSVTGYTPTVTGRIHSIQYKKTDFADGVDFTITTEDGLETVWTETNINAAETVFPRLGVMTTAGVALYFEAANSEIVPDHIVLVNDRVKIVIASGGNVKSGAFDVVIV